MVNVEPRQPSTGRGDGLVPLELRDPSPFEDTGSFWRVSAQAATIAMFLMFFGALLFFARPLLLPVLSAMVVALTAGPAASWLERRGVPVWATALLTVLVIIGFVYLAIITLSQPASEMIARSGEIGAAIKEKFQLFERPIAALRELQAALHGGSSSITVDTPPSALIATVVTVVTPAVVQVVLFLGTLFFFMLARNDFRHYVIRLFDSREGRLRALKILNDIEENLSGYLIMVTMINLAVGVAATIVAYLLGLPSPFLLGAMAFALNYLPYIGPGIMHVTLFVLGLLTFPSLWLALIPPAIFIAFTIIEGQFLVPSIIGHRFELPPLLVFLNIAFWAWLWGPIGAFLSMPILIAGTVAFNHLYPKVKTTLPG
jgi:predicted PurR-regulated permease PerM